MHDKLEVTKVFHDNHFCCTARFSAQSFENTVVNTHILLPIRGKVCSNTLAAILIPVTFQYYSIISGMSILYSDMSVCQNEKYRKEWCNQVQIKSHSSHTKKV